MVLIGKTNTDEFAMGSSTENSAYTTTRNPGIWNEFPADQAVAVLRCGFPYGSGSSGTDTGGVYGSHVLFVG